MSVVLRPQPGVEPPAAPAVAGVELPPVVADPARRGLPRSRTLALFAAPLALLAVAYGVPVVLYTTFDLRNLPPPQPAAAAGDPDGAALFARHCAQCHGPRGDGHGTASPTWRTANSSPWPGTSGT
jgi:mono/diheme cytochrome c family protein